MLRWQADVQWRLKPALWIPGCSKTHMQTEEWFVPGAKEQVFAELLKAAEQNRYGSEFSVRRVDREKHELELDMMTPKLKWLDEVILTVLDEQEDGRTRIRTRSASTGCCPLLCPCAPFCSVVMACFPFGDNGKCEESLDRVRAALGTELGLAEEIPKKITFLSMSHPTNMYRDTPLEEQIPPEKRRPEFLSRT